MIFAECECNEEGSANGNVCHQTTGVCTCKAGWHGYNCQQGKLEPATQDEYLPQKLSPKCCYKNNLVLFSMFYAN